MRLLCAVVLAGALDQGFTREWIIDGCADNRAWIHDLKLL